MHRLMIINFGSLNIDKVYRVNHIVKEGETIFASQLNTYTGGKGLNQSIAIARAGAKVLHAGAIGPDGAFLENYMKESGVDCSALLHVNKESGHAMIQVNDDGQNSIVVFSGANSMMTDGYIDQILAKADSDTYVLLQNETSCIASIIKKSHQKGLKVVWNPSPFPADIAQYPLDNVDVFVVNEIEGAALAGMESQEGEEILSSLEKRFPGKMIVLTLGKKGVLCSWKGQHEHANAFSVDAVDTTAAGDTFMGYFLASLVSGEALHICLVKACAASAIAVSRPGAAPSIPKSEEVEHFLSNQSR